MSELFDFFSDNKAAIGTIVGVVGLITGIAGGMIGYFLKYRLDKKNHALAESKLKLDADKIDSDKKSAHQQMITNNIAPMRQAWINDVREKASQFLSNCDFIAGYKLSVTSKNEKFRTDFNEYFRQSTLKHQELCLYLEMALPFSRDGSNEEISDIIRSHLSYINDKINELFKVDRERHDDIIKTILCCTNNFKVLLKNEWNETKSLKEIDSEKYKIEKLPPPTCTCSVKDK